MKILQIIQKPQFRGAEIFACQLSVELTQLGYEVDVLFLTGSQEEKLPFPLSFLYLNANLKRRFWDFKAYKKLNTIVVKGAYDVVQANAADTLKYTAISKMLFRWKAKLVFRNANKMGDFLDSHLKKYINAIFVKNIDFVASVSELCKDDFLNCFPFYKNPVFCLPIGVPLKTVVPYYSFAEIGLLFPQCNVFVHVGSFVPEKNHKGLISIFEKYLKADPSAKLLLIGEGKLKPFITQFVSDNGMGDHIFFLGKRDDVLRILPLCKALLLPSLIEGLPGVILEAMWSKTVVIANNVGGIGEVVTPKTGFLIAKNEEGDFVKAMENLLLNEEIKEAIVSQAFEMIHGHYNLVSIAESFAKVYNQYI